ncbi:hypothetical protein, partial [Nocardia sp. NPDC051570]|uniref:hypothetical protein n=1 Tax=Nocardia sp. NPDC051570 TaxID=3364324 RepID=UPI00378BAC91
ANADPINSFDLTGNGPQHDGEGGGVQQPYGYSEIPRWAWPEYNKAHPPDNLEATRAAQDGAAVFSRSYAGGAEVVAELKNGRMTMAIDNGEGTVRGRQMFEDAMDYFGPKYVMAFDAKWNTGMSTNLDAFNANIRAGMSIQDAATNTFTGHMAAEYGLTRVAPGPMKGEPGHYTNVEVTFERP